MTKNHADCIAAKQLQGIDLPELEPGVTLLDVEGELGVTPMQAVVIDRLLTTSGQAFWVDGGGREAKSTRLRELAPHTGHLDRIQVARSFTAYQHTSLIDRLSAQVEAMTQESPALVVATGVDLCYREDDLEGQRAQTFLLRQLAVLSRIAREQGVPVLVTRVRNDEFSAPIANAARTHLRCEATQFGPRFVDVDAEESETLVYHTDDGYLQTTIAFWREILEHRAQMADPTAATSPGPAVAQTPGWE